MELKFTLLSAGTFHHKEICHLNRAASYVFDWNLRDLGRGLCYVCKKGIMGEEWIESWVWGKAEPGSAAPALAGMGIEDGSIWGMLA